MAYFYGEEGPLTGVFGWKAAQDLPDGYAFDFVNSDVILNHLTFNDGRLVTPRGTSYRVLYLGGRISMSETQFRKFCRRSFERYMHGICK